MKRCSDCEETLSLDQFHRRGKGHQSICAACKRLRDLKRYADCDLDAYKATRRRGRERRAAESREFVVRFLRENPCLDCGEDDIVVLEFDHVRGVKDGNISEMVINGVTIAKVRTEVSKCEVVCANCHRRRTAMRRKFYRTTV